MKRILKILLVVIFSMIFLLGQVKYIDSRIKVVENITYITKKKLPDIIDEVISSVVHISNNSMQWQGSGVAIAPDIIVTAGHVVEFGTDFTITLTNGVTVNATKAISSKKYDVGFIKLDECVLTPAKFGSIDECRLGQSVFVIGSQFGMNHFNSVTLGVISAIQRDLGESWGWQIIFQIDAGANSGSSGSPVFDMTGKVIGIVVGSPTRTFAGIVYIIPIDLIINDGTVIRLMFDLDKYKIEIEIIYEEEYY